MSVEQALMERWQTYHPLTSRVPITKVFTGWVPTKDATQAEIEPPVVSLTRQGDAKVERTNQNRLTTVQVQVNIWDTDLDRAMQVSEQVLDRFDGQHFPWSEGSVLDCRQGNRGHMQEETGMWRVMLDYQVTIQQPI